MPAVWHELPSGWITAAAERPHSLLLATLRGDAGQAQSLLFLDPAEIVIAASLSDIPALFARIEAALAEGLYAAGYVGYECGYHFQGREALCPALDAGWPLAWFGLYREPLRFMHATGQIVGPVHRYHPLDQQPAAPASCPVGVHSPPAEREHEYRQKIGRIHDYIRAGDIYQANLTERVAFTAGGSPAALFSRLALRQPAAYTALLSLRATRGEPLPGRHLLSLSPELFFSLDERRITTRPMKGTMARGLDLAEDAILRERLWRDEKNRAEHVMIVDLLRNDLGRLCQPGSIAVEDLFTVATYRTLLQMTSTVSGQLRQGVGYYEIFRSLFPGGSITGAPKIRAMEVLRELEQPPRGVYTGAIGYAAPGGKACFNIAIRTIELEGSAGRMGVGGGIVADSIAEEEARECRLKAVFLTATEPVFQLLETMLWEGASGYAYLDLHLDRLQASAAYFAYRFDRTVLEARLREQAGHWGSGQRQRVRVLLDRRGEVKVESAVWVPGPLFLRVRIAAERTDAGDVFLRHKTTFRPRYDRLYREARSEGFDEVLFLNQRGELSEGAISNVFVERGGRLLTPPLGSGVLPGVLRRHLLATRAGTEERVLRLEDLEGAEAIYLGNSVRGLVPVREIVPAPPE